MPSHRFSIVVVEGTDLDKVLDFPEGMLHLPEGFISQGEGLGGELRAIGLYEEQAIEVGFFRYLFFLALIPEPAMKVEYVVEEGAHALLSQDPIDPELYLHWGLGLTLFGRKMELGEKLLASCQCSSRCSLLS